MLTDSEPLCYTGKIPDLFLLEWWDMVWMIRTGSTANLVTASSPDSFKQTLPSGILQLVRCDLIKLQWGPTGGPPSHFAPTQVTVKLVSYARKCVRMFHTFM